WSSTTWVNGRKKGKHTCGYTPFSLDVSTEMAQEGQEAGGGKGLEILVFVDSTPWFDDRGNPDEGSWWYDGGGIYRHVYLEKKAATLRIARDGAYLPTLVDGAITVTPTQMETREAEGGSSSILVADATLHPRIELESSSKVPGSKQQ
ncbi:unnamed protein product, partial [Amoebophrya sp. A25]